MEQLVSEMMENGKWIDLKAAIIKGDSSCGSCASCGSCGSCKSG
jgi:hypothetical protein